MFDHDNGAEGRAELESTAGDEAAPFRIMVAAVLSQAILDALTHYKGSARMGRKAGLVLSRNRRTVDRRRLIEADSERLRAEADAWLRSDDPREFGVIWCCSLLGIDLVVLRERLERSPRECVSKLNCYGTGR